ncbi:MAG: hypothetical protein CMB67_03005 [Euryarchaeota archaeon]|nr:hypothetical protein [Euryarchaeota archaeon]
MVSKEFQNPSLAVDAIALRESEQGTEVLLIRRKFPPWEGRLAFPGGFVDYGEDPADAVLRELLEETGLEGSNPEVYSVKGDPMRDPRKHVVSIFYLVEVDGSGKPTAGDDASEAHWLGLNGLRSEDMAGDHIEIVEQLRK